MLTPYLWFAGIHGTIGAKGREVGIHASAADVLSHFNIGLMGGLELRKKRFLAGTDFMWIKLSDDEALPLETPSAVSVKAKVTEVILTPQIGYRVIAKERLSVDGVTGFRYWHLGQNLRLQPSRLGFDFTNSQNWVDPIVGGRIRLPLTKKTSVLILGDVGGWDVGSQLEYQAIGLFSYDVRPNVSLKAGYRYLDVNYRSGAIIFDTASSGLMLGVTFNIK